MATPPKNPTESGIDTAFFHLNHAMKSGPIYLPRQLEVERLNLAQHVGLALGLGLAGGAALGVFATLARRWKEEA